MNYALRIDLERPFDEAVRMIKESLAESGFGILTEIDLKATLKNKIDVDIDDQIILGACNPRFAYRGLQAEPSLGLLLPCNVVVRADPGASDDTVIIDAMNPQLMVQVSDQPGLREVADDAAIKLQAAVDALGQTADMRAM